MTKKQLYILIPVVVILILALTNPSEESHIQSVKSKLKTAFNEKNNARLAESTGKSSSLGNGIGSLLGEVFIEKMVERLVSRENYILFSTTKANYKGQEKIIGFGILGYVFISDKIKDVFNKDKQEAKEPEKEEVKEPDREEKSEQVSENIATPLEQNEEAINKSTWYSKNFYGNGVTEYLDAVFPNRKGTYPEFYYYSSTNSKKIQLKVHSKKDFPSGMEGGTTYKVSFPNQKGIYSLTIVLMSLTCENPDGKSQDFIFQQ